MVIADVGGTDDEPTVAKFLPIELQAVDITGSYWPSTKPDAEPACRGTEPIRVQLGERTQAIPVAIGRQGLLLPRLGHPHRCRDAGRFVHGVRHTRAARPGPAPRFAYRVHALPVRARERRGPLLAPAPAHRTDNAFRRDAIDPLRSPAEQIRFRGPDSCPPSSFFRFPGKRIGQLCPNCAHAIAHHCSKWLRSQGPSRLPRC